MKEAAAAVLTTDCRDIWTEREGGREGEREEEIERESKEEKGEKETRLVLHPLLIRVWVRVGACVCLGG